MKKTYLNPEISFTEIQLHTAICSGETPSGLPPTHTDQKGNWEAPGRILYV